MIIGGVALLVWPSTGPTAGEAALDELFGVRVVLQNFVGIRPRYRHEVTNFAKLWRRIHQRFLRRIAQHHLDGDSQRNVTKATAEAALHEMLFSGGALNTRLLGGEAISNEAMGRAT